VILSRRSPAATSPEAAVAIHSVDFRCFISTRHVDDSWETVILDGDPDIDEKCSPCLRLFHPNDCNARDAVVLNDLVAQALDKFGEGGLSLSECGERVAQNLIRRGVVTRAFWPSLTAPATPPVPLT